MGIESAVNFKKFCNKGANHAAKRFVVYGRVQGVGFRYFTWKEAEKIWY